MCDICYNLLVGKRLYPFGRLWVEFGFYVLWLLS